MADQWYYTRQGQQSGPVTSAQLRQLAACGQLQPRDLVWRPGMKEWITAEQIGGLFSTTCPVRTPEPPPTLQRPPTIQAPPIVQAPAQASPAITTSLSKAAPAADRAAMPSRSHSHRVLYIAVGIGLLLFVSGLGVVVLNCPPSNHKDNPSSLRQNAADVTNRVSGIMDRLAQNRNQEGFRDQQIGVSPSTPTARAVNANSEHGANFASVQVQRSWNPLASFNCSCRFGMGMSPDGKSLLFCRRGFPFTLVNMDTNQEVGFLNEACSEGISEGIAFSPDGKYAVWERDDKTLLVRDMQRNRIVQTLPSHRASQSTHILFSPDGRLMVTASYGDSGKTDNQVNIWNVNTWQRENDIPGAYPVAISTDSRLLAAAGSPRHCINYWDLSTMTKVGTVRPRPTSLAENAEDIDIESLAYAPGSNTLAMLVMTKYHIYEPWAKRIDLWSMGKDKIEASIDDETGEYEDITLAPNGRTLVAVGDIELSDEEDLGLIHVWDLPSRLVAVLEGHNGGVDRAMFTPDSKKLVTIARDDTVRIWQEESDRTGQFAFSDPRTVFGRFEATTLGSRQSYGEMNNVRQPDSTSPYDRGYQDGLTLASEKMAYRDQYLAKPGMTAQAIAIMDDAYLNVLKSCETSRDQVIEVQGHDSPDAERLKGICDAIRKVYAEHGVGR